MSLHKIIDDNHLMPEGEDDNEVEDGDEDVDPEGEGEVEDDNIDELQVLSEEEQKQMLEETTAVRETVTKVCTQ